LNSRASYRAEPAPLTIEDLLSEIRARREEFDRLTYIPRDVIEKMKQAGIFRASTPKYFGGDALPTAKFLRTIEAIAQVDGSAAWVAGFGSAGTYYAALPLETQRKIYAGGPDQVFAGGVYPLQQARRVKGGAEVTGRWRFASGCMAADWIVVGFLSDQPLFEGDAADTAYMGVSSAAEVEIVANWDVVGMQATGSHDTKVDNKFYPLDWICARGSPRTVDEPLYRYPPIALQAQTHSVVNIGLARAALDALIEMSGATKIIRGAPRLADRAYYRTELAKGEAQLRSARSFFYETAEKAWDLLLRENKLPVEMQNLVRLSATFAAHTCADVIQRAYRVAGISAIHKSHPLQRILRDSIVVTQHAMLSELNYESAGAIFAGVPPGVPYP
jgi:indole-3-acetate monooxygenase